MVRPSHRDRSVKSIHKRTEIFGLAVLVLLVVAGVGGLLLPKYCFKVHSQSSSKLKSTDTTGDNRTTEESVPFSLLVTLQFTAVEHKEAFLKDIQPLAEYVKSSEPMTLAYEVLLSDKDPLQVLILERYRDKEIAFVQVHRSSEPFQTFRPKLQAMQEAGYVTVSGHSYLDAGVGFGDRA